MIDLMNGRALYFAIDELSFHMIINIIFNAASYVCL